MTPLLAHLGVVGLVALLVGLLATAVAAWGLVRAKRAPEDASRVSSAPPAVPARRRTLAPAPRVVKKRNPFCSSCSADKPKRVPPPAKPDPVVQVLKKAELLATVVDPRDREDSVALIRLAGRRGVRQIHPGATYGEVEIVAVRPQKVVYRHDDKTGVIRYRLHRRHRRHRRRPHARKRRRRASAKRRAWWREIKHGIRPVGRGRYRVSRALMKKIAANPALVAREARIRPHVQHGRVDGYQIRRLHGRGVLRRMGLRRGDVIRSVNGNPVTSPDRVLRLARTLASAHHVQIGVHRRGRTTLYRYAIH